MTQTTTGQYDFLVKLLDKKIEHLQKAIQFVDASCEDDSQVINKKLSKLIHNVEKRKKSLQTIGDIR